jgi:integrase
MPEDAALKDLTSMKAYEFVYTLKAQRGGGPAAISTKNQFLQTIHALVEWAVEQRLVDRNPIKQLKDPVRKDQDDRGIFDDANLRRFFCPILVDWASRKTQTGNQRWGRWERMFVPLMALTMGTRIREAAQLFLDDLREEDGILCIRIRADESRRQSVKNRSSIRTIPVSQAVLDKGFAEFVELRKRETRGDLAVPLYPACVPNAAGDRGAVCARWFARSAGRSPGWLTRTGVDEKDADGAPISLYSLRHTALTRMNEAGVEDILRDDIAGHGRKGSTGTKRYVKGSKVAAMRDAMDSVDWTEALKDLPGYQKG